MVMERGQSLKRRRGWLLAGCSLLAAPVQAAGTAEWRGRGGGPFGWSVAPLALLCSRSVSRRCGYFFSLHTLLSGDAGYLQSLSRVSAVSFRFTARVTAVSSLRHNRQQYRFA